MKIIKIPIIPVRQTFAKVKGDHVLNYEAICIFTAIGFFLDQDCYYKDEVCLRPATLNTIDDDGFLIKSKSYFQWHYTPGNKTYEEILNEFTILFESIIDKQVENQDVILPLSGGLDSRTQAVALNHLNKKVNAYSYQFKNGYQETKISKTIANICGFSFKKFEIEKSYLWDKVEDLAELNKCYAEFTHPRQMAVLEHLKPLGNVFSLGHWGDVLFDNQTEQQLSKAEELQLLLKKVVKPGGIEIASKLWKSWQLEGEFKDYLQQRIQTLLDTIDIKDSNAKIRTFKSMYWAPRWTTANLALFESVAPISLPYYANEMCQFICSVPESFLANRQLQIDYIKQRNANLAKITWQEYKPFNLYNYNYNKTPFNLPYRILNKLKRIYNAKMGKPLTQRNWELQFLGNENDRKLQDYLFNNKLQNLVSEDIIKDLYNNFKTNNSVKYSHPISMLLTLSLWQSTLNENTKT